MKKFFLPLVFLFTLAMTSCEDFDQDFSSWTQDGVPAWIDDALLSIYRDNFDELEKYSLSSYASRGSISIQMVRIHKLDSKQYVSIFIGRSVDNPLGLITPNRPDLPETVIYEDASNDVRKLGCYYVIEECFTPGGKKITDKLLARRILSSPSREISSSRGGCFAMQTDLLYGLDDSKNYIKPYFSDKVRTMCEDRLNQYGERFFWGSIEFYNFRREGCIYAVTDEYTDGRGTPFVLETYIMNDDNSLTRYTESFIAAEDGEISPLPFNDIKDLLSSKFGIDYNPFDFFGIWPIYYFDQLQQKYNED